MLKGKGMQYLSKIPRTGGTACCDMSIYGGKTNENEKGR